MNLKPITEKSKLVDGTIVYLANGEEGIFYKGVFMVFIKNAHYEERSPAREYSIGEFDKDLKHKKDPNLSVIKYSLPRYNEPKYIHRSLFDEFGIIVPSLFFERFDRINRFTLDEFDFIIESENLSHLLVEVDDYFTAVFKVSGRLFAFTYTIDNFNRSYHTMEVFEVREKRELKISYVAI